MQGCFIITPSNDIGAEIAAPLPIAPGDFAVVARSGDPTLNGGVVADYEYPGLILGNASSSVELWCGSESVDAVAYDNGATFPDPNGAAMQLDPSAHDAALNGDGSNWCAATTPFGAGDLGTPGSPNTTCF